MKEKEASYPSLQHGLHRLKKRATLPAVSVKGGKQTMNYANCFLHGVWAKSASDLGNTFLQIS